MAINKEEEKNTCRYCQESGSMNVPLNKMLTTGKTFCSNPKDRQIVM